MKIKRILAVVWVVALFILLIGGIVMQGSAVAWLENAGVRVVYVDSQAGK